MPIEIRELIIKAEVGNQKESTANTAKLSKKEKQQLIQDCAERVLEILKDKNER